MKIVEETGDFGGMIWRLMSRDGKTEVWALPITGLGTYLRTIVDGEREEPVLLKNVLMLEQVVVDRGSMSGLVDAKGQETGEPVLKCLGRELLTVDMAKKRFMPKGKPVPPGLDVYPGAILTQEQRVMPMVQPADGPPPEIMAKLKEAADKKASDEARS